MSGKSDQFREDVRFRVLRLLQSHPEYSQRQVAQELGVSLGAVNYCLNALAERGLVKIRRFTNSNNKLGYAYILTPAGVAEKAGLVGAFLQRKRAEFEIIKAEIETMQAELDQAPPATANNADMAQGGYGKHQE
ncbi:MarR family EPS-associated transcriptional regulator [Sphingomonas koreensis]|uniref:MarR family EPS-associated transcriptional regulator n=1 Tax=Sphingomonas koreensis TaxID=93064 RepID=A0A2M8WFT1_9SPHN|nr:MarR family EPS-associated transcriptional regulator [Sphingomonas koreensis]PJI89787.1 EPS-associated MarR family transcriptional regulator [Sphingomonas koreensis]RSU61901.1 MarR family EPS-associated transcriptional regulator [Sphingomonas koreensis]RSU70555.1 MarR family EPS-associated transcriptional regulator [Sphingomonas koreensis]RSY81976.1 MarR family EPS-associated transcriptional regulator [Sphingomonas koreensis]